MTAISIVWHRRDLRLQDNPALAKAAVIPNSETVGIFIFDPDILKSPETGGGKVDFMLGCLKELQQSYRELGSELLCFYGNPKEVLAKLAQVLKPQRLFFNQDVEPSAIKRDQAVIQELSAIGIEVKGFLDIALHAPQAIATKSTGEPYKVYSPFWKNWITQPKPSPLPKPQKLLGLKNCDGLDAIPLPSLAELGFSHNQTIPASGEEIAQKLLTEFCDSQKLYNYKKDRDFPAIDGTSNLSPHLRFGTIGIRDCWAATVAVMIDAEADITSEQDQRNAQKLEGIQTWRQELAWREFYQHVLFHFPQLSQSAYRPQMQRFAWDQNHEYFQAWSNGRTGYPIVDAAMRQLNQTGWMHNRCRMIVASFLTKDLILNWQWGELYFMQKLIDGDLAANNGGWQWSASSGMDTQPLRIFNPSSQALKFDPEGTYIRRWLPELVHLTTAELLSGNISNYQLQKSNYPAPIVDHAIQQRKFKERYQLCK
ncbi:deoxyribodipyrimidine photolyase [Synechococcus sp. PCC 7502]|uniref:cryptochrome/photolyase family protein n=1 Tax=Synechococcus sp. PCC 7502 TaxID=1173263 RepID=UPI00029FDBBB|nr:deoxyribodipyrimidine photo-lyase [Synechococcus sp. PCC 7502]AFY72867.1 deoxyribodipyrimidine photolyase [Synechococcus sp. PCC 7502]